MRLKIISVLLLTLGFYSCQQGQPNEQEVRSASSSIWQIARDIEQRVHPPSFPEQDFNILDFGAQEAATNNQSKAFADAIKACNEAGGGRVVVPSGIFYTGPIHLLDNVNLHFEEGAEIRFSTDPSDYLPLVRTSFEGTELMNYSPLIYAFRKKNIAITGKGSLNGQASAENWWPWKGREEYGWQEGMPNQNDSISRLRLIDLAAKGIDVRERIFGDGYHLRPNFVEFFECKEGLIEGVSIKHAPFWIIHPFRSENITIDGVTVDSHGPNNDGCDPEYCKNVIIKNCLFNTGDDCIAIKSGRNEDGRSVGIKSERILIKNCEMLDGHGGVVVGSEISAGLSHVFVENCRMSSPNLDRAIRIKTNSRRGGLIEHIYVRNLEVGEVKEAVLKVNMFYSTYPGQTGEFIPQVQHLMLENVRVKNGGKFGILAKAYKSLPINDIVLKDVVIDTVEQAFSLENVENLNLSGTYINGELVQNPTNIP